ncbi:MAG: DNA mismatch repair protein MutS [Deltaproteobacteria bacterium]|nr:DNA mismatch repair protein MutS [Deltaproteobacteria bacterium]
MGTSKAKTPVMRQYLDWKSQYPDAVLMFRLGDFYEMFYEDAIVVSRALDLTLTSRDKNKENPVPMCGVPYHTLDSYLAKLVEQGHKVAVCDQMEDAKQAKGIVKRAVTRVVTPGVNLDMDHLEARRPNYLLAVRPVPSDESDRNATAHSKAASFGDQNEAERQDNRLALAFADVSTGEFRLTVLDGFEDLEGELARLAPKQIVVPRGAWTDKDRDASSGEPAPERRDSPGQWSQHNAAKISNLLSHAAPMVEEVEDEFLSDSDRRRELAALTGQTSDALDHLPRQALGAALMVARYIRHTIPAASMPPLRLVPYVRSDYMALDEATFANLEIFATLMEGGRAGSLLKAIDQTVTPMGGRALRRALAYPLQDLTEIRSRHDAVEILLEAGPRRTDLRKHLKHIADMERLARRIGHGVATPRDLAALRRSLELIPDLARLLQDLLPPGEKKLGRDQSLLDLGQDILQDIADQIGQAMVDEPPTSLKDGGVIRPGYDVKLDSLVALSQGGKDSILAIEERERTRTGIASLKIKYNKVFGYYIEVTRTNLAQVPDDYTRKQTLVNAERFTTPELAEHETRVLEAEEKRLLLEQTLFDALRNDLSAHVQRISNLAAKVATVDLLAGFAEQAALDDYVRPNMSEDPVLDIRDGRHPVVEQYLDPGSFVPNDTSLDAGGQQLLIVTGPNMAGKSTIIRQVALIALLAHTGSFVPARSATIGIMDRIFTRVGASDNLARGESTFMVEMKETAKILRYATKRSLVILDEIGRGTSTFDGMSLAWAVAEYLHDAIGARTMFATHYHELCALADVRARVRNYTVLVREWKHDVVFLHKLAPGGVNRSYGIQVARLAGVPAPVIARAEAILKKLEKSQGPVDRTAQLSLFADVPPALSKKKGPSARMTPGQASSSNPQASSSNNEDAPSRTHGTDVTSLKIFRTLEAIDPDALTPRQAIDTLYRLKAMLKKPDEDHEDG